MITLRDRPADAPSTRAQEAPELSSIKRVSLKEMLRWAYNRQQVDTLSGKLIEGDQQAFTIGEYGIGIAAAFSALGTRVDSAGSTRFAKNDVHPDAELLHDRVIELGPIDARLVVQFGHTGTFPEPMVSVARPRPLVLRTDRQGKGRWHGEGCEFRLDVAEIVFVEKIIYGCRELVPVEVEFCPIEWWPDPAYVAAVNGIADYWERTMMKLRKDIVAMLADPKGARFVAHEIVDLF
jgi:hypothetical protein